jgi:hypothetical protein
MKALGVTVLLLMSARDAKASSTAKQIDDLPECRQLDPPTERPARRQRVARQPERCHAYKKRRSLF